MIHSVFSSDDFLAIKRSLQGRLQELEITSSSTAAIHSGSCHTLQRCCSRLSSIALELQEAIEAYKSKTDEYLKRYEEAEINRAKAARAEAFGPLCYTRVLNHIDSSL